MTAWFFSEMVLVPIVRLMTADMLVSSLPKLL